MTVPRWFTANAPIIRGKSMDDNEYVVEFLQRDIIVYTALRNMLLQGEIEVLGVVAGTDGSHPDHFIFQPCADTPQGQR